MLILKALFLHVLLYLQVLLPPYDDSVSVPPKQAPPPYSTATAWKHYQDPADWTLLLMKPQQNLCTTLPLQCTVYSWIYCCYTHIQYNTPCMHWHVQSHLTHHYHHRDLSPLPVIYWWTHILAVTLLVPILSLSIIPEMMCIFMHLSLGESTDIWKH